MQIHDLKPAKGSRHRKKIVGRGPGSGWGKTAGRGENGQRSRRGHWNPKASEGGQMPLLRRLPKVGFRNPNPTIYQIVNIHQLQVLGENAVVTAEVLKSHRLIGSRRKPFKILGNGEITIPLVIQEGKVSEVAKVKIEKAGGVISVNSTSEESSQTKSKGKS
jgi:large subunit ribosomal protein L15